MSKNISVNTLERPFDVSGVKVEAPFVCLIYSNHDATIEEISSIADWLLSSGCRYVVCAGKNCQVWHDTMDEVIVINEVDGYRSEDELIMTTWHEDESIEDVVFFWLQTANFDDINFENYLALIIGESKEIKEEIEQRIKENSL